jgi:hypothetical protein
MTVDDRLLYEARTRTRYAVMAAAAGVLLVLASVVLLTGPHSKVSEATIFLIYSHKRVPRDVIGSVIDGVGLLALVGTLRFLFGATRARNPGLKPFALIAATVGGVFVAVGSVAYYIEVAIKANQFVSHGSQTWEQANHLTSGTVYLLPQLAAQLGVLLLAVGFVLISLNALRVGLLTRFMGYLGIFAGVLVIIPIGSPVPVVEGFWLFALAYLFSGRWPSGVPPAWRTGSAERWPSSAELRAQRTKAGGGGRATPTPKPAAETVGAPSAVRTRASTPKRKRKRRR